MVPLTDSEFNGVTSHHLAGRFHFLYGDNLVLANCPHCGNELRSEKEPPLKNIGFRLWRAVIQRSGGELYSPIKELIFGGRYRLAGFKIICTHPGEDILLCDECGEFFHFYEIGSELNIVTSRHYFEEVRSEEEESKKNAIEAIKQKSSSENFVLNSGEPLPLEDHIVGIRRRSTNNFVEDIIRIRVSGNSMTVESLLKTNKLGCVSLLKNPDHIEGALIASASITEKQAIEEHLVEEYSPHYYDPVPTSFRKAVLEFAVQRWKHKYRYYRETLSPF